MDDKNSKELAFAKQFDKKGLSPEVNLCNEFLMIFLGSKKEVKKLLENYFKKCVANAYDNSVKKFNLERWSGGEVNPTLEIVKIKDEFKFATTHYGILSPLSSIDLEEHQMKEAILGFFFKPLEYFPLE